MYETHFGLKKRPFRALALGHDVFIGPQTAATMAGVKKALTAADAIVAVSGPVGGGKTTVAGRALDGVGKARVTIPVGRIKLGHDEVLELLLEELGVEELPAGTVQRFTMFRRMLRELADKGTRVIIVVEDAVRIGADSLAELEALTAADAGVSDGANVVLMGDTDIDALLDSRGLARLKQRLRLRQALAPFSAKELLAYFKHCFRLAGSEFDSLFAAGSADLIHQLSSGIPRMANNIAESAMAAAAEDGLKQVTATHIQQVAAEEYGVTAPTLEPATVSPVELPVETLPAPGEQPTEAETPPAEQDAVPIPELAVDKGPAPEPAVDREPAPEPDAPAAPPELAAMPADEPDADIPELIQDTLPNLKVLAPKLARAPAPELAERPAPAAEQESGASPEPEMPGADDIPVLSATQPDFEPEEVPAWDRDPTLAELRPDLDALEHAMAVAHGIEKEPEEAARKEEPVPEPRVAAEPVPEITLDREIEAKIEEAAEEIKRTEEAAAAKAEEDAEAENTIDIAQTGEIEIELPPLKTSTPEAEAVPEQADVPAAQPEVAANDTGGNTEKLQKIAANLSRAQTIDDVDDLMAETLFGDEFSEIAAQVAAKASEGFPANDELELVEEEAVAQAAPVADLGGAAAASVSPAAKPAGPKPQLDEAAEQRLATVRALNGAPDAPPPLPATAESIVLTDGPTTSQPPANGEPPESIEDQISTSITQTLKALNVRSPVDDDHEDEDKKGFFSRFRKS